MEGASGYVMVMQKNLFGMALTSYMQQKAYEAGTPISATFELTPRCGFNCRMCYVHLTEKRIKEVGNGRELTGDEWLEIGRQACEMGVLSVCITGGDPVCHPEFQKIWVGLSKMGFRLTLQTNGAMLTEEILQMLEEYPPELVKITLYGSNDKVYEEVCRVSEGFTRADRGIKELQDRGFSIQLVTTFIQQNRDDAEEIFRYAKENHLPWYYSASCYPSLRGAESEAQTCAIPIWDEKNSEQTSELWNKMKPVEDKIPAEHCSSYRTGFNISWDGEMRFCLLLNEPHIKVVGKDLTECWKELLDFWEDLRWPKECYRCEYKVQCKRCLAHLACFSGGLNKLDREYCKKIQKMIDLKMEKK